MKNIKKIIIGLTWLTINIPSLANQHTTIAEDCTQKITLPAGYTIANTDEDCDFGENMIPVSYHNKVGYANQAGKIVIKPTFAEAHGFDEGLALIKKDDKYGFINPKGKIIIKPTFDDAWSFSEGRAKITQNGKYGFIDKTGKIVIAPTLTEADNWFAQNLVAVKKGDKWGFIGPDGRTKIAFEYDYASGFSEGLALVAKKNSPTSDIYHFGFIDKYGNVVIPLNYDNATSFIDGTATVTKDNQIFYINKQGKRLTTPQHTRFL
ncbi:WG repeat-containing protein [Moraxella oblonga]|uniref:WG repeat-containing protein n=1 Tax=Moraxella oblonga TaxID=200413 RepID=UPI0008341847|nr:WG repeat-containing protein [Moraxella oblonga]